MKSRRLLISVLLICSLCGGCVRRRMTIRSNPPGALVYIDDQEIGRTPVSTSFTYYGTRKIRLVHEGYETMNVMQRINAPWYQIPPLDFFSENLYPRELRDERYLDFNLEPQRVVPRDELLSRATELRSTTQAGFTVPMPGQGRFDEPGFESPRGFPQSREFDPRSEFDPQLELGPQSEFNQRPEIDRSYDESTDDFASEPEYAGRGFEERVRPEEFPEQRHLNRPKLPASRRLPPPFYPE